MDTQRPIMLHLPDPHLDLQIDFTEPIDFESVKEACLHKLTLLEHLDQTIHQALVSTYQSLAVLYHRHGKLNEAKAAYLRALTMQRQLLGDRHLDVALTLQSLGALSADEGQVDTARLFYEQALYLMQQHLGADDPRCRRCEAQLASLGKR